MLTGGGGADTLNGGTGTDTAVLTGGFADYAIVENGDGSYTVTDLRTGAPDGTDTLTGIEQIRLSSGTYAITDAANTGPTAVDDGVSGVIEAGRDGAGVAQATGNVLANDTDPNLAVAGLGETLTVTGVQAGGTSGTFTAVSGGVVVQGLYGTLTINPDGSYTYQLDNSLTATDQLAPGAQAADVFGYRIVDAHGVASAAMLSIGITGADDTLAGGDVLQVTRARASSLDAAVLLGNDTGTTGETLTVTGVSNAVGATVSLVNGRLVITAAQASGGFDYTVTSSGGGTATGHVDLSSITTPARITATAPAGATAVDYVGGDKVDTLKGEAGSDRLVGNGGKDVLDGGAGADRMEGGASADRYYVDNAGDRVIETNEIGVDTVVATLSSYTLGDNVENLTFAGSGDFAGTGNALRNVLIGGAGNDMLSGGDNIDTLIGGAGDDVLDGGAASDIASYAGSAAGVTVDLRIVGGQETGGAGHDALIAIENVVGTAFADLLSGTDGGNTLSGGANRDTLYGNGGADRLIGGGASDMVYGGTGADTFVFQSLDEIAAGDRIADFNHAQGDLIDVSTVDADMTLAGQQTFTFIGTAAFTGAAESGYELRYQPGATTGDLTVQGDTNHDGVADISFVVHASALQASDFILVGG